MPDLAALPARPRTPQQRADDMLDTITRLRGQLAEERRYTRQWVRRCADALREADQAHAHIQAVEDELADTRAEIERLRAQLDGALALAARWEQTARTRPAWRQRARQLAGNVSTAAAIALVLALIVNAVTRPAP